MPIKTVLIIIKQVKTKNKMEQRKQRIIKILGFLKLKFPGSTIHSNMSEVSEYENDSNPAEPVDDNFDLDESTMLDFVWNFCRELNENNLN